MKQHLQIALDHEPLAWINGVVYSNRPAWYNVTARALHMDLIVPKERPHHAPQPAVLFLCGGAYMVMDRSIWLPELMTLARAGYTVASMEYRTSNEAAFPAALEDVKTAIRFLRAQGHTVRVVCADQDKAGNECFYVVPELNLYLLNPIVERNGVTLPRLDRSLLEDAIRDCDVVHTTFVLQLSHTAVKIAKAYNKPITSSFHCQAENVTAHFLCKDLDAINRGVYRACYQMVYQYSDIIHYPTQFIRDTFEAVVGPTNGRVISNGVNSMFTPGPAKRPAGLEGKFLIVSTGRLSSEKNQEILIKAIGRSAHREQIHLILAGEGPREEHYRHLADKYGVDMEIAFFSRQDLLNLLRCADLYCHPAEVEIESIACLEAIACGLVPVIANSPKSAAKSFALDEKSLFKNKDPEDMAAKIDYWVEHPAERADYSRKYLESGTQFEQQSCMRQMEQMLFDAVALRGEPT